MIIANVENSIFDYEAAKNVIVLPITQYVRKDGNLVVKNELTKHFFEKYPNLSKKWGYMISQSVEYPTYETQKTSLLGLPDRSHYASSLNEEILTASLWYLKEQALIKFDCVFYVTEDNDLSKDILMEFFQEVDNIVMFRKEHKDE